jgi:uncharacterized protein (DUF4415 family)
MSPKLKPEKITTDNPEATDQWFAKAKPAADILPELFGSSVASEMLMPKKRGRPVAEKTKTPINIRLDHEIVDAFKNSGAGWQTKINEVLKDWLKTHPIPR